MTRQAVVCLVLLFLGFVPAPALEAQGIEISGCPGPVPGSFAAGAPLTLSSAELAGNALTNVSVPRCADIVLTANAITGRPPLAVSWTLDDGTTAAANPATMSTASLTAGPHLATFRVSNPYGVSTRQVSFIVEPLGFALAPSYSNLGDNTVAFAANTLGATEWQWDWGDGTATGWLPACTGSSPQKTYASSGVYTVLVRARNCRDPYVETSLAVHATPDLQPRVTRFQAEACPLCIFPVGLPVLFTQTFTGTPASYSYDWDGDGTVDEVSTQPVARHAYAVPGSYLPSVSIDGGPFTDSRAHPQPISVELDAGQTRPSAPAGLSATLVAYQVAVPQTTPGTPPPPPVLVPVYRLTWTDTSATEKGFALYQSENGGPFVAVGAYGPNTSTSQHLTVSSARSFRVTAFNSGGESLPSAEIQVAP